MDTNTKYAIAGVSALAIAGLAYYLMNDDKKLHKCKTNEEKLAQGQGDEEWKSGEGTVVDGKYHL